MHWGWGKTAYNLGLLSLSLSVRHTCTHTPTHTWVHATLKTKALTQQAFPEVSDIFNIFWWNKGSRTWSVHGISSTRKRGLPCWHILLDSLLPLKAKHNRIKKKTEIQNHYLNWQLVRTEPGIKKIPRVHLPFKSMARTQWFSWIRITP